MFKKTFFTAICFGIIPGLIIVIAICVDTFWTWNIYGQENSKPNATEKTITITESQLNELVEKKIAQQLINDTQSIDDKILQPGNWHYVYFRGIEYCVYTGPGQILSTKWDAPAPEIPKDKPTEKPTSENLNPLSGRANSN